MVVVDNLDERLDAAALLDHLLAHAAGDLEGVALDTGDDGVGEGVRLGASVVRLDNDDLLTGVTATGDDGHTAHFHELHGERSARSMGLLSIVLRSCYRKSPAFDVLFFA